MRDVPDSGESFENADVVPISRNLPAPESLENGAELPALDSIVANVPDETKQTLKELFRAEFSEVRRFKKDELR